MPFFVPQDQRISDSPLILIFDAISKVLFLTKLRKYKGTISLSKRFKSM